MGRYGGINIISILNNDFEILEDNTEEIKELEKIENGNVYTYNWIEVANKVNELVKAVNKIKEGKEY